MHGPALAKYCVRSLKWQLGDDAIICIPMVASFTLELVEQTFEWVKHYHLVRLSGAKGNVLAGSAKVDGKPQTRLRSRKEADALGIEKIARHHT